MRAQRSDRATVSDPGTYSLAPADILEPNFDPSSPPFPVARSFVGFATWAVNRAWPGRAKSLDSTPGSPNGPTTSVRSSGWPGMEAKPRKANSLPKSSGSLDSAPLSVSRTTFNVGTCTGRATVSLDESALEGGRPSLVRSSRQLGKARAGTIIAEPIRGEWSRRWHPPYVNEPLSLDDDGNDEDSGIRISTGDNHGLGASLASTSTNLTNLSSPTTAGQSAERETVDSAFDFQVITVGGIQCLVKILASCPLYESPPRDTYLDSDETGTLPTIVFNQHFTAYPGTYIAFKVHDGFQSRSPVLQCVARIEETFGPISGTLPRSTRVLTATLSPDDLVIQSRHDDPRNRRQSHILGLCKPAHGDTPSDDPDLVRNAVGTVNRGGTPGLLETGQRWMFHPLLRCKRLDNARIPGTVSHTNFDVGLKRDIEECLRALSDERGRRSGQEGTGAGTSTTGVEEPGPSGGGSDSAEPWLSDGVLTEPPTPLETGHRPNVSPLSILPSFESRSNPIVSPLQGESEHEEGERLDLPSLAPLPSAEQPSNTPPSPNDVIPPPLQNARPISLPPSPIVANEPDDDDGDDEAFGIFADVLNTSPPPPYAPNATPPFTLGLVPQDLDGGVPLSPLGEELGELVGLPTVPVEGSLLFRIDEEDGSWFVWIWTVSLGISMVLIIGLEVGGVVWRYYHPTGPSFMPGFT